MKKTVFKISGMHCSTCVISIDGNLEDQAGVKSSRTSFAKQTCEIEFDEAKIDLKKIIEIVKKIGYKASLHS